MKTPRRSRSTTPYTVTTITAQLKPEIVQRADQIARELGVTRHRVICQAIAAGLSSVAAATQQQQS